MNVVLIGFMGSGKSTVARRLSERMGLSTVEMDDLVYQRTSTQNMNEVFKKGGELFLRETEIAIAKEYALKKNLIISTGGGVVLNKIILDYFKETGGKVIFLHVPLKQIIQRLEGDVSRPLLKHVTNAKKLYDVRLPLYLSYADAVIDVRLRSPDEVALQIEELLSGKGCADGL